MATWVVLLKKEITALSCMYCFHNLGNSKQPKYLDIHTFRPCLGNPLSRVLKMIEGDCGGFWLVEDLIPFNPFNRHKPNKALSFFLIVCHFFFCRSYMYSKNKGCISTTFIKYDGIPNDFSSPGFKKMISLQQLHSLIS